MREGKKSEGGAFKPPPPPDRIGLKYQNIATLAPVNIKLPEE